MKGHLYVYTKCIKDLCSVGYVCTVSVEETGAERWNIQYLISKSKNKAEHTVASVCSLAIQEIRAGRVIGQPVSKWESVSRFLSIKK